MTLHKNRKASVLDIPYLVAFLFLFGTTILISNLIIDKIRDDGTLTGNPTGATVLARAAAATETYDSIFVFILALSSMLSIVGAYFVRSFAALMVFALIFLGLSIILAGSVSGAWTAITTTGDFATAIQSYPMTNWIMDRLGAFTAVLGGLVILAMYSSPESP